MKKPKLEEVQEKLHGFHEDVTNFAASLAEESLKKFVEFVQTTFPEDNTHVVAMAASAAAATQAIVESLESAISTKYPDTKLRVDLIRDLDRLRKRKLGEDSFPADYPKDKVHDLAMEAAEKIGDLYRSSLLGLMKFVGQKETETDQGFYLRLGEEAQQQIATFAVSMLAFMIDLTVEQLSNATSFLGDDYHTVRANVLEKLRGACGCEDCQGPNGKTLLQTNGTVH